MFAHVSTEYIYQSFAIFCQNSDLDIVFYNHIILQIIAIYMIIIRKPYCFNFHDISETNSILLYFCGRNYFEPQRVNKIFLRVLGNRKFIRRKRDDTRLTSINITAR